MGHFKSYLASVWYCPYSFWTDNRGFVAVAGAVTDADEPEETDVGMAPPEAVEELSEEVDDFLSDFFGYL